MPFNALVILDKLNKVELAARLVAVDVQLAKLNRKLLDIDDKHVDCDDCQDALEKAREIVADARKSARGRTT